MSARAFLWRWNLRVVRGEWRQYTVIFVLILCGVLLSIGGLLAAYNLVEPPESEFGAGQFSATTDDPQLLEQLLDEQSHRFAIVDSATIGRLGTTQRMEVRRLDPGNPVVAPLVALLEGRLPVGADEVAVTDRALVNESTPPETVDVGTHSFTVVGVVENPTDLSDEFVLAADVEIYRAGDVEPSREFLIDAAESDVNFSSLGSFGTATTGPPIRTLAAIIVSMISALGMLEVALLVGSSFAVIATRRSRQFGLLAAAGATPKQIRASARNVGTIIGVTATVIGVAIGTLTARLLIPRMETAIGHRIDFAIPWWAVGLNALVAITIAGLAARWPARSLSKQPVAHLLSSMRPRPEPVGRGTFVGVVLTAAGVAALAIGFAEVNTLLAIAGTLVAPVGLLLMTPFLVHLVGRFAKRLPLSSRLAARAIARHTRRSASVVAALALAISLPVGVAVVTTSLDQRDVDQGPNLAENWLVGWVPGADDATPRIPVSVEQTDVESTIGSVGAAVPELAIVPIQVALPSFEHALNWDFASIGSAPAVDPVVAGRPGGIDCAFCDIDSYGFGDGSEYLVEDAWIATPELLAALDIDAGWLDTGALAVARSGEYVAIDVEGIVAGSSDVVVSRQWPKNTSIPSMLLSPSVALDPDLRAVTVGWLAVSAEPISPETRTAVIEAVGDSLLIESHEPPAPKSGLRSIALALGLVLGLGIAMSAVALLTAEFAGDRKVLSSIGASPRTSRRMSASIGAMLAGCGAIVAVCIGYLPLVPMLSAEEAEFPFVVPWGALLGFLFLLPASVAATAWWVGRTPERGEGLRESS